MTKLIENIFRFFTDNSDLGNSFRYSIKKTHSRRNDIKQLGDVLLEVIGVKDPKEEQSAPNPTDLIMVSK